MKLRKLVLAALFAALACGATMVIQIPSPIGGYLNLGDCIVLLAGWLLGPVYGAVAAGLGPALADIFSSYTIYAPATFVIKALMAIVAFYACDCILSRSVISYAFSAVVAEAVMVGGYYLFEATFLGYGFVGASVGIVGNLVQAAFGIVCAVLIKSVIDKKGLWKW